MSLGIDLRVSTVLDMEMIVAAMVQHAFSHL